MLRGHKINLRLATENSVQKSRDKIARDFSFLLPHYLFYRKMREMFYVNVALRMRGSMRGGEAPENERLQYFVKCPADILPIGGKYSGRIS